MAAITFEQAKASVAAAVAAGRVTPEAGQSHLQELVGKGFAGFTQADQAAQEAEAQATVRQADQRRREAGERQAAFEQVKGAVASGVNISPKVLRGAGVAEKDISKVTRQQSAVRKLIKIPGAQSADGFNLVTALEGGASLKTIADAGFNPTDIDRAQAALASKRTGVTTQPATARPVDDKADRALAVIAKIPGVKTPDGFVLEAALEGGATVKQLVAAKFKLDDINRARANVRESIRERKQLAAIIRELKEEKVEDLLDAGFTQKDLAFLDIPDIEVSKAFNVLQARGDVVTPEGPGGRTAQQTALGVLTRVPGVVIPDQGFDLVAALEARVPVQLLIDARFQRQAVSKAFNVLQAKGDLTTPEGSVVAAPHMTQRTFEGPTLRPSVIKRQIIRSAIATGMELQDANQLATIATKVRGITPSELEAFKRLNTEFKIKAGLLRPGPGTARAIVRKRPRAPLPEVLGGFPVPNELLELKKSFEAQAVATRKVGSMSQMGAGPMASAGVEAKLDAIDAIILEVKEGRVTPEDAKIIVAALPSIPAANVALTKELLLSMVPVEGTRRNWADAPGWANAVGVAADVAAFIPLVGQMSGLVRSGATAPALVTKIAVAEITGPIHAVRHPIRTIGTILEPIETALAPRKIPVNAVALKEATIRVPVVEGAKPAVFDIRVPQKALIRSPELRTGTVELSDIQDPAVRAQVAATLTSRDIATRAAVEGVPLPTNMELGSLTGALTLHGPRLQRVIGPAAVHNTPDLRPFLGGIEAAGSEGGLYTGTSVMERFIRGKATGGVAGLPAKLQDQVQAGLLSKDPVPGALIIRDQQVLDTLAGSNKLWAGHAEIELVVPNGTRIPPVSQLLFTRTQDGSRATLAIVGKPFTPAEILRLKVVGSVDTVVNMFKSSGAFKAVTPTKRVSEVTTSAIEQIEDAINKTRRITVLRSQGKTALALKLAEEVRQDAAEAARRLNRASRDASLRLSGRVRPAVFYTGGQDIARALDTVSRESLRTPVPRRVPSFRIDPSVVGIRPPSGDEAIDRHRPSFRRPTDPTRARATPVDPTRARATPVDPTRARVTPVDPTRARATPVDPTRARATPVDPTRARATPVDPTRARATPVDPTRARATPVDPTRARATPVDPTRARATPVDPTRARATPVDPTRARVTPVDPTRARATPVDPTRGGFPIKPEGRSRPPGFRLPSGAILKKGTFPRVVEWQQGFEIITFDLQSGRRSFKFSEDKDPQKNEPISTFRVVSLTTEEPVARILPMGLFNVVVTQDTLDFTMAGREIPIVSPTKKLIRRQMIRR